MRSLRPLVALLVVVATITAGIGAGVGPVAAQESDDGGLLDGWFGDSSDDSSDDESGGDAGLLGLETASTVAAIFQGAAIGLVDRVQGFGEDVDAIASADAVQTFVNNHSGEIQQYINARTTASTEWDTIAVTFHGDEAATTRYVVADVSDGNYTNGRMVGTTDREIDERCELAGQAVANAPEEVRTLYDEFVKRGADIDAQTLGQYEAQYLPDVDCSFGIPSFP